MFALPAVTAVTSPVLFTVATDVLSELQLTVLLVAPDGETVALSCCVPLTLTLADIGLTLTPVTGITGTLTVIMLVAVLLPSCDVTVMFALPAVTAVTSPELFTVATDVLSELQLTVLFVAPDGEIVAVSCCVPLTVTLADIGLTLTLVTGITGTLTVITLVAVLLPS